MIKLDKKCRRCRREGQKLFLKGEKCLGPKCPVTRRAYAPGDHGKFSGVRMSEYGKQLREKEKAMAIYGLKEKQLKNYYKKATQKSGDSARELLVLLETRLDSVLSRLNFAISLSQARQIVRGGHIMVGGKKVDIPSYQISAGDKISIVSGSMKLKHFQELSKKITKVQVPTWIKIDKKKLEGTIDHLPEKEEINVPFDTTLILEFYSR